MGAEYTVQSEEALELAAVGCSGWREEETGGRVRVRPERQHGIGDDMWNALREL